MVSETSNVFLVSDMINWDRLNWYDYAINFTGKELLTRSSQNHCIDMHYWNKYQNNYYYETNMRDYFLLVLNNFYFSRFSLFKQVFSYRGNGLLLHICWHFYILKASFVWNRIRLLRCHVTNIAHYHDYYCYINLHPLILNWWYLYVVFCYYYVLCMMVIINNWSQIIE